jgi:SAM-dependent methyltransferase
VRTNADDVTDEHKTRKRDAYWTDLVGGGTASYKLALLEALLDEHPVPHGGVVLDVGCGTSGASDLVRNLVGARSAVRCDYDASLVAREAAACSDPAIEFRVADIFELAGWTDEFSLVLFLDMLHEVYSFVGRGSDIGAEIDHATGLDAVRRAVASVSRLVAPGGGIVITDNVVCEPNVRTRIGINEGALPSVRRFLDEYPSRRMTVEWLSDTEIEIGSRDLCILLTQYNKIKRGDEARWAVEQLEIHQYMTEAEYRAMFDDLGFDLHARIGTPQDVREEWDEDFRLLSGLDELPAKRITLVAIRR